MPHGLTTSNGTGIATSLQSQAQAPCTPGNSIFNISCKNGKSKFQWEPLHGAHMGMLAVEMEVAGL
jgi:hypothetical protein